MPRTKLNLGKVHLQDVTPRHKTPCDKCGEYPERFRLQVKTGGGRFIKTSTLCLECAERWARDITDNLLVMITDARNDGEED